MTANAAGSSLSGRRPSWPLADLLAIGILISVCLLIALPRYLSGIDFADEGTLAYGAVRVSDGQVPNRDFVSFQPPLCYYTAALTFTALGTSLVSLRVVGLSLYLLLPLLLYGIARTWLRPVSSFAAAIPMAVLGMPFFNFVPFAVWQGITASVASVYLLMRALHGSGRGSLAIAAGVMTGASLLLRHDQALYAIVALAGYLLASKYATDAAVTGERLGRVLRFWPIGAAVVLAPLGLYWLVQGAVPQMVRQLIVFPVTTYARTSSLPFPSFSSRSPLSHNLIVTLFYLPPVIEAIAAVWLLARIFRKTFGRREVVLSFLLTWAVLFYFQVLTRSDLHHLLITMVPFPLFCAYAWDTLWERWQRSAEGAREGSSHRPSPRAAASLLMAATIAAGLWTAAPLLMTDTAHAGEIVSTERAGVRVRGGENLAELIRTVQREAPPDRSILCLPYQPVFYFLCARRNPTHWNYIWAGDQTPEDHERLIQQAKADPPAAVLIASETEMGRYAPKIVDYVHQEFRLASESGGLKLYLPKP